MGADKPNKQIDALLGSEQLVTFDQEAARLLAAVGEPVILLCVHQKDYPLSSRRPQPVNTVCMYYRIFQGAPVLIRELLPGSAAPPTRWASAQPLPLEQLIRHG